MQTVSREILNASVIYSLAEVARMEQERQREEHLRLAKAREERERQLRLTEAARQQAEQARRVAEDRERRQREHEAEQAKALTEARARALVESARIEAETKAQREAESAERAHHIAVLRVREEGSARRLRRVLAGVLCLACSGSSLAAYEVVGDRARKAKEIQQLRSEHLALVEEYGHAKNDEFSALGRRHAALRNHPLIREVSAEVTLADEARKAINENNIDPARLSSFRTALDQLQERLDGAQRMAELDRRYDDLSAWASQQTRSDIALIQEAASRAKSTRNGDPGARVYEHALDRLRRALSHAGPPSGAAGSGAAGSGAAGSGAAGSLFGAAQNRASRTRVPAPPTSSGRTSSAPCRAGDPLCDLSGRSL